MKARIKGLRKYGNTQTVASYEPPAESMEIEAESIEIVEEPKKREVEMGELSSRLRRFVHYVRSFLHRRMKGRRRRKNVLSIRPSYCDNCERKMEGPTQYTCICGRELSDIIAGNDIKMPKEK